MSVFGDILGFGETPNYEFLNQQYQLYFDRFKRQYQNRIFPILMQNWRRQLQTFQGSQRGSLQNLAEQKRRAIGGLTQDLINRGISNTTVAAGYKQDLKRDYARTRSQIKGDYAAQLGALRGSKPVVSRATPEIPLLRAMAGEGLFTGFKENPSTWQQMGGLGGLFNLGTQALGFGNALFGGGGMFPMNFGGAPQFGMQDFAFGPNGMPNPWQMPFNFPSR